MLDVAAVRCNLIQVPSNRVHVECTQVKTAQRQTLEVLTKRGVGGIPGDTAQAIEHNLEWQT
eukprot:733657-Rhodomonas_salina.1